MFKAVWRSLMSCPWCPPNWAQIVQTNDLQIKQKSFYFLLCSLQSGTSACLKIFCCWACFLMILTVSTSISRSSGGVLVSYWQIKQQIYFFYLNYVWQQSLQSEWAQGRMLGVFLFRLNFYPHGHWSLFSIFIMKIIPTLFTSLKI